MEQSAAGAVGSDDPPDRPRGGIDVFESLFVRQPIRAGATDAVRDRLAEWAGANADGDVHTLVPVDGVQLATLFLDRGAFGRPGTGGRGKATAEIEAEGGDALLWYLEVVNVDTPAWTEPVATVQASPVFEAGLEDLLTGTARVHASNRAAHRYVTHATNPTRRDRYRAAVGRSLIAPVAGDELPIPVAVKTLVLRSGWRTTLVDRAIGAVNWLKARLTRFDRIDRAIRDRDDVLRAEAMYTESLLFDASGDPAVVYYYMETEDMEQLYDAFAASEAWETRLSAWLIRRVFENATAFLTPPLESDAAVLIHAVAPDRP